VRGVDGNDADFAGFFQGAAVGGVAVLVLVEQLLGGAGTGETRIVALTVIGPFRPVGAIVEGSNGWRALFADIGGSALFDGRAAVGGILADVLGQRTGCHGLAGKARIVAFIVIGPAGAVVARFHGGPLRGRRAPGAALDGVSFPERGHAVSGILSV